MPRSTRKVVVSLDTYLSILAVVSSFCAIGITFYQAYLQRTQQYASVMPIMDSYLNDSGGDKAWQIAMIFVNNGVGPAIVKETQITYKKQRYSDLRRIAEVIVSEKLAKGEVKPADVEGYSVTKSDLWPERVISPGQAIELCNIDHKHVGRWVDEAIGRGDIRVKIWYESIYGERWRFDTVPERIELRNVKIE
ncbi:MULTISPECIES: hypothetical protein [unclassified Spirosoma]|uniref:hypothetical protein n=1 Tax=unclassified Spirosoma TaxID=2621999 RepID=UPI000967DD47|nr:MULTISPECIES: hypothetical protein [unclassified Spirosoma]MBN8826922.1 hypothetical protein [Spirosoma sp.]OJW74703.1 MAG: hypothetical protein BGO59_28085 [Spirosoma sp. 48-14]